MFKFSCIAAALGVAAASLSSPANALVNRAWVSAHGTDAAGCGAPSSPCRSLQYVHDNIIAAGGEIDVLDPAGYGAVTITKALSIVNDGVGTAGVQASSGAAITVAAPSSAAVQLRGLTIEGVGGTTGVQFSSGASLDIARCVIRNFTNTGIAVTPNAAANLTITDSIVSSNGKYGIQFFLPQASSVVVNASITRTLAINNLNAGVALQTASGATGAINVGVVGGVAANNGRGYYMTSLGGTATLTLREATTTGNSPTSAAPIGIGVYAFGQSPGTATVRLAHSLVTENQYGVYVDSGSTIYSYGDNDVNGNTTDISGALTPDAEQ